MKYTIGLGARNLLIIAAQACPCFHQWSVLVVDQEASHIEKLLNASTHRQWYGFVKEFVLFDPSDAPLHMDPQTCNGLSLPDILPAHLGFFLQKGRPVNFALNQIVHKEPFVDHYCHVWCEQAHDARQLENLPVTHRSCIQARHKCNGTMWCHADHGLECSMRLVC